ncbi:MAG: response regulator [Chloroflexi bacterium]|nr:response regulator [Chloroflexota bacterium]
MNREKPASVLVVDDDRTIRHLIRNNLEDKDTRVAEADTGFECIRRLHEEQVDLVVLDLNLPDFNGWSILSLLRLTAHLHHMPVIIVSVEPPDAALMRQLKPDDYIQKPFDTRDLVLRVRKVIDSRDTENPVIMTPPYGATGNVQSKTH